MVDQGGKGSQRNRALVEELWKNRTIRSPVVRSVMEQIDRGEFCDNCAYEDSPQLMGFNVTISAPHMHAYALEFLRERLASAKKCLDVGSGSGYLTLAFLKLMPADAVSYGVEHIPELVQRAIDNISKSNKDLLDSGRIVNLEADGRAGLAEYAPYDAIHVGAACETLFAPLLEQLAPGGRMLVPVGDQSGQDYLVVDKDANGNVHQQKVLGVRYVPLTSKQQQLRGY